VCAYSTCKLDGSDSAVEFIAEGKGDPERERREKPVVRSTPPVVDSVVTPAVQAAEVHVDVLDDGDSDDPDRDRIVMQRLKVKLEMDRLAKYEAAYIREFFTACAIGFIDPRVYQPGRTEEKPEESGSLLVCL